MSCNVTEQVPVLIIGYGNPLRRDDGIGWVVAQRLANDLDTHAIQVVACHQLTPDLAEPVSRAAQVIFIDARADGMVGQVSCQWLPPDLAALPTSAHHLTPAALLAWSSALYGASPGAAWVISVNGACFDYGEGLSPAVTSALPVLVNLVAQHIAISV